MKPAVNPHDGDTQCPDQNHGHQNLASKQPWARLVAVDRSNPDIELRENSTIIGRGDVNGNKRISKFHCKIYMDSSGHIYAKNLSKNGTLINGSILLDEDCKMFDRGDEITLGLTSDFPGLPQYILHIHNNPYIEGSQDQNRDRKRTHEAIDSAIPLVNGKHVKLSKMKEDFICCICLSLWHDVVTVSPCLHNFCNGCFSEWYKNNKTITCKCPQCLDPIVFVKRNHTLCNILQDYLEEYPSLKRSSEETAQLDQMSIVGNDTVNIGTYDEYDDSSTSGEDDNDYCRQCPRLNVSTVGTFLCGVDTPHLLCSTCNTLMPERSDIGVPQKCAGCNRPFCGLYWNSQNMISLEPRCVMKKMGMQPISDFPALTFQGNAYEQNITKQYIQDHRIRIQDIVQDYFGKMCTGIIGKPEFLCGSFSTESFFCNDCADSITTYLLYQFRLSIPRNELPLDAARRDDCWYGRLCRTQRHNVAHTRKYNHVCEPTPRARVN